MEQSDYLKSSEHYNNAHSKFYRWVIYPVCGLLIGSLIFIAFGTYESSITTTATVSSNRAVTLQTTLEEPITVNNLKEGRRVRKGAVLIRFDVSEVLNQQQQLQQTLSRDTKKLAAAKTCIQSVEDGHNEFRSEDKFGYYQQVNTYLTQQAATSRSTEQTQQTYASTDKAYQRTQKNLQSAIKKQTEQLAAWRAALASWNKGQRVKLTGGDFSSIEQQLVQWQQQFDQASTAQQATIKNSVATNIQSQIDQGQAELDQLNASDGTTAAPVSPTGDLATIQANLATQRSQVIQTCEEQITELDTELATIQPQLVTLKKQIKAATIRANCSGYIHLADTYQLQSEYPKGTQLAQIMPTPKTTQIEFTAAVASDQIHSIAIGQRVRCQIQDSDAKTRMVSGVVSNVATTSSQTEQGSYFKVTGLLNLKSLKLRYGQVGKMKIITKKTTYLKRILSLILDR